MLTKICKEKALLAILPSVFHASSFLLTGFLKSKFIGDRGSLLHTKVLTDAMPDETKDDQPITLQKELNRDEGIFFLLEKKTVLPKQSTQPMGKLIGQQVSFVK